MRKRIPMARVFVGLVATWILVAGMGWAQGGDPQPAPGDAQSMELSAGPAHKLTLMELLGKGGPVMYPLYFCSLLMVTFGIERAIRLQWKKVLPPELVEPVRALILDDKVELDAAQLLSRMRSESSPIARILEAGLRRAGKPVAEIEKAIQYAGEKESADLRRNGRVLAVVSSVSPLLGLLGTVFGMIEAFMTVASREEALGRTELLAAGIYQALVTTAVGLCIAIPALVLHHIYVEKVDRLVTEMDDIATQLVERIADIH